MAPPASQTSGYANVWMNTSTMMFSAKSSFSPSFSMHRASPACRLKQSVFSENMAWKNTSSPHQRTTSPAPMWLWTKSLERFGNWWMIQTGPVWLPWNLKKSNDMTDAISHVWWSQANALLFLVPWVYRSHLLSAAEIAKLSALPYHRVSRVTVILLRLQAYAFLSKITSTWTGLRHQLAIMHSTILSLPKPKAPTVFKR